MANKKADLPSTYPAFLSELKECIYTTRLKAGLSVNRELIILYHRIGVSILKKVREQNWGAGVLLRLSQDLQREFPDTKGFSHRNLKYMRQFAESYETVEIGQHPVAQLPWGHNVRLLDYVKDSRAREWYARQAIENGWSRNVLELHIEGELYQRQGKAITNFSRTLPEPQSDLAQQITKDKYAFDLLGISSEVEERDIERSLVEHIQEFIMELGKGFAFVGRQYPLEVAGEEYRIDLLFYHLKLRCFVVFEIKTKKFKPEYTGKMNFYLSAVDDMLRHEHDHPTIGIILCKTHDALAVEYALRGTIQPMGVAGFKTTTNLPAKLEKALPTAEELAEQLRQPVIKRQNQRKLPKPNEEP